MASEEPPFPPPLLEDKWVKIQENTFTNWVNQQLREAEYELEDIGTEFCDGVKLCVLVAALQNKKGIKGMKLNPKNRHQMIENVTLALHATKLDKIKIVNIGPEDIVNGNKKLILGLIWSYILRYQIGKTEIPPKQLMLAWINAVIPDCKIKNFTTDWNNGKALFALIDYCEPGLAPDWRNVSTADRITFFPRLHRQSNCEIAMRLAQERLGVPIVVSPQNMASTDLDQLSGMTYLSYFMKMNSCGYKATLREVNKMLPNNHVTNFTSDWRDGVAVCALVQAVGGHIPDYPQSSTSISSLEVINLGLQAGKEIGILPILSGEDMVQPQVGHLAVMAYAARFMNKPAVKQSAASYVEIMFNTVDIAPGARTQYSLLMKQGDPRLHTIKVTITDLHGNSVPTSVEWGDNPVGQGNGVFTPTVTGPHQLKVECDGDMIRGCPIRFNVTGVKKQISVIKRDQGIVGEVSKLELVCDAEDADDVQMICESPSGERKEVALSRSTSSNSFRNSFVPDSVGEWQVSVLHNREHTAGSPFTMNVIKPQAVNLYNLQGGLIGQPFTFMVDTSQAGKAELQCVITSSGRTVPSKIQKEPGNEQYSVEFTPPGPGVHLIRTMYGGKDVRDEPYKVEIADSNLVQADGAGLSHAKINHPAHFTVDVGEAGVGDVVVNIKDSNGVTVPCSVRQRTDRLYDVEYTPLVIGTHEVMVQFADKQVRDSPFSVNIYNDPKAHVPREGVVDKPVIIHFNTADTGRGDLHIIVNGGTILVDTKKESKDKYSAEFVPRVAGEYAVELHFNNSPIQGSPWVVDVTAPAMSVKPAAPAPTPVSVAVLPPVTVSEVREVSATPTQYARVGEMRSFNVSSNKKVNVKIQDEFGGKVPFDVSKTSDSISVSYQFQHVGGHWVHLTSGGKPLVGSPFLVCAFNPNLVAVRGLQTQGEINVESNFTIDARSAGKGEITVQIDEGNVACSLRANGDKTYNASYVSSSYGVRTIDVFLNQVPVAGSPFQCSYGSPPEVDNRRAGPPVAQHIVVPNVSAISVSGDGLHICEEDKMASFIIDPNGQQGHPDVRIEGPHSVAKSDVQPVDSGENRKFKVTYIPVETGIYNIHIRWTGEDLIGSPFHPRVVDSRKVKLEGDWPSHLDEEERLELKVSQTKRLLFDVSRAGPGELKASGRHLDSGTPIQCTVTEKDQFHYWIDILADEPGEATIDVEWNDFKIPRSPIRAIITEGAMNGHVRTANKVVLSGEGIETAVVGKITEFYIDGSLAEEGAPEVQLKNSKLQHLPINVEALTSREYHCTYTVEQPGTYMLYVSWNGKDLDQSPYTVISMDQTSTISSRSSDGPDKISAYGPGLEPGILANFEGLLYVDTSDAGKGECVVKIQGPKGDLRFKSSLEGPKKRLLQCEYNPTEVGVYIVRIRWSGQDVANSPIIVHIFDSYDELNRFKNDGQLPAFMVAQDNVSLHSTLTAQPIYRTRKPKSFQPRSNPEVLLAHHPPIQRSHTTPSQANGRFSRDAKKSFFIVKENAPNVSAGRLHTPRHSMFVANR